MRSIRSRLLVLLVLLLGVRPILKALRRDPEPPAPPAEPAAEELPEPIAFEEIVPDPETGAIDPEALSRQVGMAQRLVAEKPDAAVHALRQMLASDQAEAAA